MQLNIFGVSDYTLFCFVRIDVLAEYVLGFLSAAFVISCFLKNPGKNMNDLIDAPLVTQHVEEGHLVHDANKVLEV